MPEPTGWDDVFDVPDRRGRLEAMRILLQRQTGVELQDRHWVRLAELCAAAEADAGAEGEDLASREFRDLARQEVSLYRHLEQLRGLLSGSGAGRRPRWRRRLFGR